MDDFALIVASSKIIDVDDLLNIGLHIPNEFELNIGLKKSTSDLVETIVENFLIDDGRIAHLLESTGYTPS